MAKALLCHPTSATLLSPHGEGYGARLWGQYATKPGITLAVTSQACRNNLVLSNSFQVARVAHRSGWRHGWLSTMYEGCSSSNIFSNVFKSAGNSNRSSHQRYSQNGNSSPSDGQPAPTSVVDTEIEATGTNEVEIVEDHEEVEIGEEDDEEEQYTLDDRFERLATAMAMNDTEMAEQLMRELGNPMKVSEMRSLMDSVTDLEENLHELYSAVNKIIEEGDEETAREIVDANYEVLLSELGEESPGIEQAAMLDVLAQLRLSLGDYNEVERLLTQIKSILSKLGPNTHQPLVDNILGHVGSMYSALGKPDEAVPMFENSLQIQEDVLGKDSPLIVKLLLGLASTYSENDEDEKAIATYQRAIATIERQTGPDDERLAQPLAEMGHLLMEEGRVDEAEVATLRALGIVEAALGPEHWQVGGATCALARAKVAKGDYDEAVFLYRKGLQTMERSSDFPEDHTTMEAIRRDFAELLDGLERYDEAQELWEEGLRQKEAQVGENAPELTPFLQGLATSYSDAEKYDRAEPLLARSLKLTAAEHGPHAPETSVPMEALASVLHHLRRDGEAEPLARQALRIREEAYGPLHLSTGEACSTLASILHSRNESEAALALMQRVLAIQEKELGPDSPEIGLTLELQLLLLDSLDRKAEMTPLLLRMEKLARELGRQYDIV